MGETFQELMRQAEAKKRQDEAAAKETLDAINRKKAKEAAAQEAARLQRLQQQQQQPPKTSKPAPSRPASKGKEPVSVVAKSRTGPSKHKTQNPDPANVPVRLDLDHTHSQLAHSRRSKIKKDGKDLLLGVPGLVRSRSAEPPALSKRSSLSKSAVKHIPFLKGSGSATSSKRGSTISLPALNNKRRDGGNKADLIPLNGRKRDLRSVEEIQEDLRIKRLKKAGTYVDPDTEKPSASTPSAFSSTPADALKRQQEQLLRKQQRLREKQRSELEDLQHEKEKLRRLAAKHAARSGQASPQASGKARLASAQASGKARQASSGKARQVSPAQPSGKTKQAGAKGRRRASSVGEVVSGGAARRGKILDDDEMLADQDYVRANASSIIRGMFGRNRYAAYSDSEDSSDMEAGYDDVRREEVRSMRAGKLEDAREEARLNAAKKAKTKRT
ncbi:MAG: hypothetical protein SGCHY_001155 [Lobulomycetales sp.]